MFDHTMSRACRGMRVAILGVLAWSAAAGARPATPDRDAIWRPAPGTTWQWQLTQPVDPSVDAAMYDVDLFETPAAVVRALHARGRRVVCYMSAGSLERWR